MKDTNRGLGLLAGLYRHQFLSDRVVAYSWRRERGTSVSFKFRPRFGLHAKTTPSTLCDYYEREARVVLTPVKFVVRRFRGPHPCR